MRLDRVMRGLVIAGLFGALVYVGLAVFGDAAAVLEALSMFSLPTLVLILLLSIGCYTTRAYRWGRYLKLVGHPVDPGDWLYLQFAGMSSSLTPGRLGELLKPWLSREVAGAPLAAGIPLIFAERVSDLIAVAILSLGGLSALRGPAWLLALGVSLVVAGAVLAGSEWFHALVLRTIERQSWARRYHESTAIMAETIRLSMSWRALLWSTALSMIAWGFEGVGFALCLRGLAVEGVGLWPALSVYCISTIAGALTFLPGGIGLTEASMTGILVALGLSGVQASAATVLTRVATLWWGVLLGWTVLLSRPALVQRVFSSPADAEVAAPS